MARIDFSSLEPLPVNRQKDLQDRERLAHASAEKKKAHHKGRNHFHAWQKRLAAKMRRYAEKKTKVQKQSARDKFHAAVRAYWSGLSDEHP